MATQATIVKDDALKLYIWPEGDAAKLATSEGAEAYKIGRLVSIGDVGGSREEVDTSTIDSVGKQSEAGTLDEGSTAVGLLCGSDVEYARFKTLRDTSDNIEFCIVAFNKEGLRVAGVHGHGIVTQAQLANITNNGLLQVNGTIKINGQLDNDIPKGITFTSGIKVTTLSVYAGKSLGEAVELAIGEKTAIFATVGPANATNKNIEITSADTESVEVLPGGIIYAKKATETAVKITVKALGGDDVTGEVTVTVK